jgi:stage V sporulation protein B
MDETRKFAFDVSVTFIASIVSMLFASLITIVLGRYLGAAELGLYKMAVTFYGMATLLGAFGVPVAVIKYVSECKLDKVEYEKIVSSGLITSLIFGVLFAFGVYVLSGEFASLFHMPELGRMLKILSPIFPFVLVNSSLFGMLNGLRDMNKYAAISLFQSGMMIIVTFGLLYSGLGVAGAVIGLVVASAGTTWLLIVTCRRSLAITTKDYLETTRKLLSFGVRSSASNIVTMINLQADTFFLGYFLTASDVGLYAAATGLSRFFWLVPTAIQTVSFPATSEYWSKNNLSSLQKMIDKCMKYTALILFPAGLAIGLFSELIMATIYGQEFTQSALSLQVLITATVIFGVTYVSIGGSLAGVNRPDLGLKVSGISASINIILNIVLIPAFGIVGAAVAAAVSMVINAVLFDILTIKTLAVKLDLTRIAFITGIALATAVLFEIGIRFINQYLIGFCLVLAFTAVIFKVLLTEEDISILRSFISIK